MNFYNIVFQFVEVSESDDEQMKTIKAINSDWTHLEGTIVNYFLSINSKRSPKIQTSQFDY